MTKTLNPAGQKFMQQLIDSGLYSSEVDILNKALEMMQKEYEQKQANLIAEIDKGYKAYKEGRHSKITAKELLNDILEKQGK